MSHRGRYGALLSTTWIIPSLAVLVSGTAYAVDGTWTGPGSEWTAGTNWSSTPTVPDNTATFTNNGAPTSVTISNTASIGAITFTAPAPAYSFAIGNNATFTVGGTNNTSSFTPGFKVDAGATLQIGNGGTVEIGSLANGASGGGTVVIGTADPGTLLAIAGSTSTTFSGSFSGAGSLELDNTGTTLTLTGASNSGNIGTIGGDLTLCDCFAGGLTISGGALTVTGLSQGIVVSGGTLSVINGGSLRTDANLLMTTNMIVSGAGSNVTVAGVTGVGIFGPATLTISNGGTLDSQSGAEIDSLIGTPAATVTGPGSTWTVGGFGLLVGTGTGGIGGPGVLTIANGGAVNVNGDMAIADGVDGSSLVTVTGPGSVLNAMSSLTIGDFCGCLTGTLTVANGAVVNSPVFTGIGPGSTLNLGTGGLAGAIVTPAIDNRGQIVANFTDTLVLAADIHGPGSLSKAGAGTLILTGNDTYSGGTTVSGGTLQIGNGGTAGSLAGNVTNDGTLAFNLSNAFGFAGVISGSGAVQQLGPGTTTLTANNTYTGGTVVNAGILQLGPGASLAAGGALTVNGGGFNLNGNNQTVGALAGTGGVIALGSGTLTAGDASNTTLAAAISGTGGLIKQGSGVLTLTGASGFTGGTTVNAGGLVVNGSLASSVTLNGGVLQGIGTIGGLVVNGGVVAPGNSIGTLTVNGNFVQANGTTYQVEVNAAGRSDRINVGGAATINGGAVQVLAQSGTYARNTTYTILNATGGVSGAYSGVSSNFAFLTPTLAYDANNVFLNLFQSSSAFAAGAQTPNQYAVGVVLDQVNPTATGDFGAVLNAMSVLSTQQGPAALNAISGQPYADFGTLNVQGAVLFMNAIGQQMAAARGGPSGGQRQALAQACEVESCDGLSPWSVWASALGGLGSVAGNGNSSTLTYNFGGGAAGIDYRVDPRFLVGIGAGYTAANQWVDSFMGRGWSDSVSVAAYGSFTQGGFYTDALAGYAYSGNQMQRQIIIPGLQPRTANGSTGANQFLGQVEAGYKLGVYAPALATLTPFGRLQTSSVTQNAFSEWGANALSLNVAQQTTNSLRTTIGADLAGAIGLGDEKKLDVALRLGWQHEFADTGRPITAAFAAAPANAFTVYGATPQRDAAIIGFLASTSIAAATSVYLRYDGAIGNGTDNHTLNVGVRMAW
jgi:outer membrane autotransporter protein